MKTKLSPARTTARRNRPVKTVRRKTAKTAKTARRRSLETQPFIAPILTVNE
jgi:hypothetical protein